MTGGLVIVELHAQRKTTTRCLSVPLSPHHRQGSTASLFPLYPSPVPATTPPELSITSTAAAFLRGLVPTCGEGR